MARLALSKTEQGQGCRQAARAPVTGEKDEKGLCCREQGSGEACQGVAAAAAPQGIACPLPAAVSLPPPACLSRQLPISPAPKAGPGSWAGRELLGSLTLQLALRPWQQLNEEDAPLCMS